MVFGWHIRNLCSIRQPTGLGAAYAFWTVAQVLTVELAGPSDMNRTPLMRPDASTNPYGVLIEDPR